MEESYGSTTYFAFSKSASCGTNELPQSYRKIPKVHGANNGFVPLMDEFIGSFYSNAHSACKVTTNPVACYRVVLMWSCYHFSRKRLYSTMSEDQIIALTLTPSIVGGFPIIYLHNMYVRAEND